MPDQTIARDRPAQKPHALFCVRCGCAFRGNPEWHKFCGDCIGVTAREIAEVQNVKAQS